jgi:hypothetical protein
MRTPRKRDCLLLACYVPPHSLAVPVTLQTSLRQRVHRAGRSPALISGCAGTFDATSSLIQGDPTRPYLPLLARVHVLTACVPLVAQSSTSSHRAPRQANSPAVRACRPGILRASCSGLICYSPCVMTRYWIRCNGACLVLYCTVAQ